ncbi:MAG TPA: protein kinase [Candidatus Sulfotelmatobacter sp.]|nr:protein kinase [Candidatus Sulfotelmatobacter sp.]
MIQCSTCGAEFGDGARFCPSCGKPMGKSDDVPTIDFADDVTAPTPTPPHPRSGTSSSRTSSSRSSAASEFLISEGRFLPGRLIAGRYRIIALLGKGGMGEVYRADDLTLGQAVAIKFLPEEATRDEGLRERFRNEVRVARRVSHPNVCRVYDVGEVDGQTFFTMEYVDGEDLASLLRRIGRLPEDKAIDIARQLCAGLAAAHIKGVLHRDLKPANVMLDGRGQAVIMDFGLAGVADDIRGPEVRSGTPAYMAPEQLEGREVSPRSDIYALGLVLYEVFTGKRAFAEKTAGILRGREDRTPSRPSSVVKDLDPVIEKVILRCLENEPSARPATALAVAGALPGGDPLAAALAAGETPSPQLVAASGETVGLRPGLAIACVAAVLVGLSIGAYLTVHYSAIEKIHPEQPPEVLVQKSREILGRMGYSEKPADSAYGFEFDSNFLNSVEKDKKHPPNWDEVVVGRPNPLVFWYRQSPDLMTASDYQDFLLTPGVVQEEDPRTTKSGMINVKLDAKGRLLYFQDIPPQKDVEAATSTQTDWSPLFAAAELDPTKLQSALPQWNSLASTDSRVAWTGVWPGSSRPLRVEAAAWHGRPVFFALIGDWDKPWRMVDAEAAKDIKNRASQMIGLSLLVALLLAGALLARRNFRHGRGDREGAWRLAVVMFALELALWLCRSHLVPGLETFGTFMLAISAALFWGGIMWMLYLAIEPWIRRRWPHALISWSRLLNGQFRDPVVGRDILLGVGFGVLWLVIFSVMYIPLARTGAAPQISSTAYLLGGRQALGQWITQIPISIFATLQFFFLLLGLKVILRKDWLAAIAFVGLYVGLRALQTKHPAVELPAIFLVYALLVLIVFRFGLVPLAVGAFTVDMIANLPLTFDFSSWYMPATVLALLSVVALAGWGFYHSLGGEHVWKMEME